MTDLRTGLVEAMAEAVAYTHGDVWRQQSDSYRRHACSDMGIALDAALGFLTDNATEWADAIPPSHRSETWPVALIAALRLSSIRDTLSDSRDTGEKP